VGSNPARGKGVCLLWLLSVLRQRSLRWTKNSSTGVLLTVQHLMLSTNLVKEEALQTGSCCTK